jgi:hypothetical protein
MGNGRKNKSKNKNTKKTIGLSRTIELPDGIPATILLFGYDRVCVALAYVCERAR